MKALLVTDYTTVQSLQIQEVPRSDVAPDHVVSASEPPGSDLSRP